MKTFPVHLLPDRAYTWVLRRMKSYDQLAYSFFSKNTKKAIKSLKLEAKDIEFSVLSALSSQMMLTINFKNFCTVWCAIDYDENFPNNQIVVRGDISVEGEDDDDDDKWKWNFQNFDFKKWLHHVCEVFHHPKMDNLSFENHEMDDSYIEPIRSAVEGLQIKCLNVDYMEESGPIVTALETFSNCEEFCLSVLPFASNEVYKMDKFMMQNLKSIRISNAEGFKIEQILTSNSERIQLDSTTFTEKTLNHFLKLWSRKCNSSLKHFFATGEPQLGNDSFDKDVILKGIKHQQVPLDSEEVYKEYVYGDRETEIKLAGGSRIWRIDGTTAVVVVDENEFGLILE